MSDRRSPFYVNDNDVPPSFGFQTRHEMCVPDTPDEETQEEILCRMPPMARRDQAMWLLGSLEAMGFEVKQGKHLGRSGVWVVWGNNGEPASAKTLGIVSAYANDLAHLLNERRVLLSLPIEQRIPTVQQFRPQSRRRPRRRHLAPAPEPEPDPKPEMPTTPNPSFSEREAGCFSERLKNIVSMRQCSESVNDLVVHAEVLREFGQAARLGTDVRDRLDPSEFEGIVPHPGVDTLANESVGARQHYALKRHRLRKSRASRLWSRENNRRLRDAVRIAGYDSTPRDAEYVEPWWSARESWRLDT